MIFTKGIAPVTGAVSCFVFVSRCYPEDKPMRRRLLNVNKLAYAALCVSLSVVLPQVFHMVPNLGSVFCPMHIPILLCGLICGPYYGLACGVLGPVLSSITTGMPPAASLPVMVVECAVYGFVAGFLMLAIKGKSGYLKLYVSLVTAMLCGRLAAGAAAALIFSRATMTIAVFGTAYFVTSFPGIVIQLILLPSLVMALQKAKLAP